MPDEFNSPALRISNIVHGRRNVAGRVEYMLDPKGQDTSKFEIPEQIVLTRWKGGEFAIPRGAERRSI